MLETIEKLLVLQDCDRRIRRTEGELAHVEPERRALNAKAASAESHLETAKTFFKKLESDRKSLELEVEAKHQLIRRYADQQFQTRKNEEYRALAHEIDSCKAAIFQIEDQEIALMEQAEQLHKEVAEGGKLATQTRALVEEQVTRLAAREQTLRKELDDLRKRRENLAAAVDETVRGRYERLLRSKGENVVVGIQHGVCGGCHMRVPPQVLVACQARKELVSCSNCGRILYHTPDMDLALVD